MTDDNTQTVDQAQPPAGDPPADQAQGQFVPAASDPVSNLMGGPGATQGPPPAQPPISWRTDLSPDEIEVLIEKNGKAFTDLLDSKGLVLMLKDALTGAGGSAQRILGPNEQLAQHMATYNPGVTHEMKGTPPAVTGDAEDAGTDAGTGEEPAEQ